MVSTTTAKNEKIILCKVLVCYTAQKQGNHDSKGIKLQPKLSLNPIIGGDLLGHTWLVLRVLALLCRESHLAGWNLGQLHA